MTRLAKLAALAFAATAFTAPAAAVNTTFATFQPIGSAPNVRFVNAQSNGNGVFFSTATGSSNVAGARNVGFSFLQDAINPFVNNVTASFTLNAAVTNTPATLGGATIFQSNINGSFSFISTSAIVIGSNVYAAGSNLLSGTFTRSTISGRRDGSSGFYAAATPASAITYTSDFLDFIPGSGFDFFLSLSSINPTLNALPLASTPTQALRTFRAVVAGNFSSDPAPIAAVPEPAVWFQLIAGFTLVGFAARRRKVTVAA